MPPVAPLADALRPVLPSLSAEIIGAIGREVPDYAMPLEGPFGVALRAGVQTALARFVDSLDDPAAAREESSAYVDLGRGEFRQGRSLDALLSAYRLGARIAWRRFARAGDAAGVAPPALYDLGEAIFAYIDELSAESAEGFAQEQAARADEASRRRRALARLLLADAPPPEATVREAAQAAGWTPSRTLAAVAVEGEDERVGARVGPGVLAVVQGDTTILLVPDPDAPRARRRLTAALRGRSAAVGPTVAPGAAARSAARALRALALARSGALPVATDGLLAADDHLAEMVLGADPDALGDLATHRLAGLDELGGAARERLLATLRAWLDAQGRIEATAAALGVHPQTVRYRLAQLRDHLGDALDDAQGRFELALALRAGGS